MTGFEIEQIDRAFFEPLRLELIASGYLPDITLYTTAVQYETAMNALTTKVELFGVGNQKARGRVNNNKVVIDRINISDGSLGGGQAVKSYLKTSPTNFTRYTTPASTSTLTYQISYVTDSHSIDLAIHKAILKTFQSNGYLRAVNPNGSLGDFFRYQRTDYKDNSDGDFIERHFTFNAINIAIAQQILLEETQVSPLITFTPQITTL